MRHSPWESPLRAGLRSGAIRGWRGFLWMMKLIVPLSLFTAFLAWSGFIERIDFVLQPVMELLQLPAAAALPLLLGLLTGIYGGIAAMVVLPLDEAQMTVIAVFLLTAHSLIQDGIIQDRSGLPLFRATAVRLGTAVVTVLIVALGSAAPRCLREVPPQPRLRVRFRRSCSPGPKRRPS